ncbi:hypothetical protein STEG23_033616, partial [Scotinomys teguina]
MQNHSTQESKKTMTSQLLQSKTEIGERALAKGAGGHLACSVEGRKDDFAFLWHSSGTCCVLSCCYYKNERSPSLKRPCEICCSHIDLAAGVVLLQV